MKTKSALLITFLFAITFANAQEESVFNRMNGVSLKNNIYLKWDQTKSIFRYSVENIDEWHDVDEDVIFKIRNEHKNNFKIHVEFYNPLQYSMKSTFKDLDDPAYQALNDFFSKLPASSTIATSATPANAPSTFKLFGVNKISDEINKSILLHQWIYDFTMAVDKNYISANDANGEAFNKLVKLINKIKDADDYLFNKFIAYDVVEVANQEFTVNGWIKKRGEILFECDNNYSKFKSELETSLKVKGKLLDKKQAAVNALKELVELLSTNFDDKIAPFILTAKRNDFKKYSSSTSFWLSSSQNQKFDDNEKAIDNFKVFLDKLNTHIKKYTTEVCDSKNKNCNYYVEDYDEKLSWKSQKMKIFQYEITKLDKDGSEIAKSNSKGEFTVAKRLRLYPYISTGLLYTSFSYPNYSVTTDNGINKVGEDDETKVNLRPSLFLNFLITNWEPVYPFLQLGVTTGINDAIFPIGLRLSIGNSFSISGGAMLGYRKDLSTLKVGDTIKDETALKSDLTNKPFAAWYFSINYNIVKK